MSEVDSYVLQYDGIKEQLPGSHLDWINRFRQEKIDAFAQSGFPTTQHEDWRYTSVKSITKQSFAVITENADDIAIDAIADLDAHTMVFIDGKFCAEKSNLQDIEDGVEVVALSQLLATAPSDILSNIEKRFLQKQQQHNQGFAALNQGLFTDGYAITVSANTKLTKPLELLFIGHKSMSAQFPYNWVIAEANSQASIIERHISIDDVSSFTNSCTELLLHNQAEIDFYLLQNQSSNAHHISSITGQQSSSSRLSVYTMTLGGTIVRNDLSCVLQGEQAHCDMFGMFCLQGKQHVDNHTMVSHEVPDCASNEYYQGILDGRSRGVFHGRIKVAQDAQRTDAQQSNNTLLLSKHAEIDTKPQLEIYADDVKCSHGATVGQLDPKLLFYLRCRGIDEEQARAILTLAFINRVVDKMPLEPLKAYVQSQILQQLN